MAIAENVKNLTSKKFNAQFQIVLESLEQAGFFKNLTFEEFLEKRHKKRERINYSLSVYKEALTCL